MHTEDRRCKVDLIAEPLTRAETRWFVSQGMPLQDYHGFNTAYLLQDVPRWGTMALATCFPCQGKHTCKQVKFCSTLITIIKAQAVKKMWRSKAGQPRPERRIKWPPRHD